MPPGKSWLSYIPGYEVMQHQIEGQYHGYVSNSHVVIQHLAAIILVTLLMFVLSVLARSELKRAGDDVLPPDNFGPRGIIEVIMKFLLMIMQFTMPYKKAVKHFPVVGTLGFFILFSNLLGLIPGFLPPTENFNTTFACGAIVFVYYNGYALYKMGAGHIAHMANPVGEPWGWFLAPLFLPVELISHSIRPCSLSIRLLCNIAGDHLVLGVFVGITPWILPVPFLFLGLFVSLMQTFIFMLLSSVYIGEVEAAIEHAHHEAHEHASDHVSGAEAAAH